MRLHWSFTDMPEVSELSASERAHVWRVAWWRAHGRWPTWVGMIGVALFGYVGGIIGSAIGHQRTGEGIGTIVGGLVYVQIALEVARSFVRDIVERQRRQ
jgi:hypothetical protein